MVSTDKVKSFEQLKEIVQDARARQARVVHCHGVFDLLHIGHIRYLTQARAKGDLLIVTLTADQYVDKGPHRPAFTQDHRAEGLASLAMVDYVSINPWPTAEETLRQLHPDVYVKGSDFKDAESDPTGKLQAEKAVCEQLGVRLAFTKDIVFSSTQLINTFLSEFPEEVQNYLELVKTHHGLDRILAVLENMSSLRVAIIGDTILDQYSYCSPLGISNKEPTLAVQYTSSDLFAGGVLAVANHVADYCQQVKLFTVLGDENDHREFITSKLASNVEPVFITKKGAPTLVKQRFVEGYTLNKLLEVYHMDDDGLDEELDQALCDQLARELSGYDLVLAADFGHGAISGQCRRVLLDNAPFLAVNTQANAGNRGYHTISRYRGADYACLAEPELRLETRDINGPFRPMIQGVCQELDLGRLMVTRGKRGAGVYDQEGNYVSLPALAAKVVDRIGAGDAVFSITSLAAVLGVPSDLMGFIGSVAGALAVEIVGNQKSVSKSSMSKYITSLLK